MKQCKRGHIGALCQACDENGIIYEEKYAKYRSYDCQPCGEIKNIIWQKLLIIFISIIIGAYTLVSLIREIVTDVQIRILKIMNFIYTVQETKILSSLCKIILNYYQIHQVIYSFDINLPTIFQNIISSIGAPIGSIHNSLDCFISKYSGIPNIYVKLIWVIFSPLGYFIVLISFGILFLKFSKIKL